eukprot:TRINITY_DN3379_c0_g1_i8.p1 TRINITY_DN3379_c0_g1~~TRINITY_DN3379_c0_g1_i8.p1  ORF type:complete len:304 (-),score=8.57 TRINITY_DN3379_c0_g1_i8:434-1345(-)
MATYEYCPQSTPLCVAETILGLFPAIALIPTAFIIRRKILAVQISLTQNPVTKTHLIKLLSALFLLILSLCFLLVHLFEDTKRKFVLFILISSFNILIWLTNMIIIRYEFIKLGYSSSNIRTFWAIAFGSHILMVLCFQISLTQDNSFSGLDFIVILYCVISAFLFIFGMLHISDHSEWDITDQESVYLEYLDRTESKLVISQPAEKDREESHKIWEKFATSNESDKISFEEHKTSSPEPRFDISLQPEPPKNPSRVVAPSFGPADPMKTRLKNVTVSSVMITGATEIRRETHITIVICSRHL